MNYQRIFLFCNMRLFEILKLLSLFTSRHRAQAIQNCGAWLCTLPTFLCREYEKCALTSKFRIKKYENFQRYAAKCLLIVIKLWKQSISSKSLLWELDGTA